MTTKDNEKGTRYYYVLYVDPEPPVNFRERWASGPYTYLARAELDANTAMFETHPIIVQEIER